MEIARQEIDGVVILSLGAPVEIDVHDAEEFKRLVLDAAVGAPRVVLDCGLVEFFDSAGLGALLTVHKRVVESGGRIVLSTLNRPVRDVFQMVGFDMVFACYPDLPRAVQALGGREA